ncbi:type VI secretion system-associated protein TagF [Duganella dendranthematis]|uniref:Type VI secretion system-associated protein TagF n=1 Tax=Duganella dendranthematis TaxID=2728021 RepID=A0ABX6M3Y9_9BURK|nr:type VI secretion system-associated protein TagF [Duganella dendranthematis]QJD89024.1 type VI secretion system-associated protein TagF [Duganella dendranthematis]
MKLRAQTARIGYFGKLPTRADFIKAADNLALASLLDDWLAEVMNLLSTDPRWKLNYDAMPPLDFAFVGTRSRRAIAGHLAASSDLSTRRYPFLSMSAIEVDDPPRFVPNSPLILAPLWEELHLLTADVMDSPEPEAPLQTLATTRIDIDTTDGQHAQSFLDFLDRHTITALEAMLASTCMRRTILAIGLLLQPIRRSGAERLDKSLVLPLPQSSRQRYLVAAFWLDLIIPFLQQADFELSLFLADLRGKPSLIIGFGGAAPETLAAIIDPVSAPEHQVSFDYAGWVDELIAGDARVQKLSAYLEQGQLSLRSTQALFHETFV